MSEQKEEQSERLYLAAVEAQAELARREAARISRREAFARIGFRAGAAVIASLTADDLLRAVGRSLERRAYDNKVASEVARQFANAGVAIADDPSGRPACSECSGSTGDCGSKYCNCRLLCCKLFPNDPVPKSNRDKCLDGCKDNYKSCATTSDCQSNPVSCDCNPAGSPGPHVC